MKCEVCQARRQRRTLSRLCVPVTFTVNYQTGSRVEFPAGTLICELERRKMTFDSTSEGQRMHWVAGRVHRSDGRDVIEEAFLEARTE